MPDMGATHVYRCGKFLAETSVQPSPSPYHLTGIESGSAHFDPAVNLVVSGVPLAPQAAIYARYRFPLPAAISSVRPLDLGEVIVDPMSHFPGTISSMVQVLAYRYTDFRKVMLGSEPLDIPPLVGQDNGMYMNLHLFAEEDEMRSTGHTVEGFHALVRMFEFPCPPKLVQTRSGPAIAEHEVLPGTVMFEFFDLAPRTRWLGELADNMRQRAMRGQPPMLDSEPQGTDPATCTPLISRISGQ